MSKYVLMTGATGLLGEYLLRDLLIRGYRFALVVRPGRKASVHERVESVMQMWERRLGRLLPRPVCIEGDVSQDGLGIDESARRWIADNCDRMLHNAAVLTFYGADREGEPWRTNLSGTRNVLGLCRQCGITDLHYVSTAYVCGMRCGQILESDFDEGQEFRNDYERSKFESEKLVRQADFINQLTIYRPAVIVGDSKTGYTATYHGLGMYLKLMTVVIGNLEPDEHGVRHTPLNLPCSGDEPRNTIPVDWVSEVMARLFDNPEAHGNTYHITPDEPFTARQLIDACEEYFNATGTVFGAQEIGANEFDRMSHEHLSIYHGYLTTDPDFDCANLKRLVPNCPNPKIDRGMIHRFLRYGEKDRWGKRRKSVLPAPFWLRDVVRHALLADGVQASHEENGSAPRQKIGLDVWGPGGGQYCLHMADRRLVRVEEGLPTDETPVVQMSVVELGQRLGIDMSSLDTHVSGQVVAVFNGERQLRERLFGVFEAVKHSGESSQGREVAFAGESGVERDGAAL